MKTRQLFVSLCCLLMTLNCYALEVMGVLEWASPDIKSFSSAGVVEKVRVQPGQSVTKNQLMAELDRRPLKLMLEKFNARVEALEPLLLDARVEYKNAQELFDRTVLSEIEVQKVKGLLDELEARQVVALSNLNLAKLKFDDGQLIAPYDARIIQMDMVSGLVITEENMAEKKIVYTSQNRMLASVKVQVELAAKIKLAQIVQLTVDKKKYRAKVFSSIQDVTQPDQYIVKLIFDTEVLYLAGQKVSVVF